MELLQVGSPIFFSYLFSLRFVSPTPRILAHNTLPYSFPFFYYYPNHLLILVLSLFYSTISPIILVFAAIFFGTAYIIFKYQLCYAYVKRYERGGDMWPKVFRSVMIGLIFFQIVMIGVLTVQQTYTAAVFLVPLIPLTLFFNMYATRVFKRMISGIPLELTLKKEPSRGKSSSEDAGRSAQDDNGFVQSTVNFVQNMFDVPLTQSPEETEFPPPPDEITVAAGKGSDLSTKEINPVSTDQTDMNHRGMSQREYMLAQSVKEREEQRNQNTNFKKVFPHVDPQEHPYPVRDDVSFLQSYEHPIFLTPLPEKLWLPLHPCSKSTWKVSESVTLSLEQCATTSDSPNFHGLSTAEEVSSEDTPASLTGRKSLKDLARKATQLKPVKSVLQFSSTIPSAVTNSGLTRERSYRATTNQKVLSDDSDVDSESSGRFDLSALESDVSDSSSPIDSKNGVAPDYDYKAGRKSLEVVAPSGAPIRGRLPLSHTMTLSSSLQPSFRYQQPNSTASSVRRTSLSNDEDEEDDDDL
jgi:hypothetical protein